MANMTDNDLFKELHELLTALNSNLGGLLEFLAIPDSGVQKDVHPMIVTMRAELKSLTGSIDLAQQQDQLKIQSPETQTREKEKFHNASPENISRANAQSKEGLGENLHQHVQVHSGKIAHIDAIFEALNECIKVVGSNLRQASTRLSSVSTERAQTVLEGLDRSFDKDLMQVQPDPVSSSSAPPLPQSPQLHRSLDLFTSLSALINVLSDELINCEAALSSSRRQKTDLHTSSSSLKEKVTQRDTEMLQLKKNKTDLEASIGRLNETVAQQDVELQQLKQEKANLEVSIAPSTVQATQENTELLQLRESKRKLEKSAGSLTEDLGKSREKVGTLQKQIEDQENAHERSQEKLQAQVTHAANALKEAHNAHSEKIKANDSANALLLQCETMAGRNAALAAQQAGQVELSKQKQSNDEALSAQKEHADRTILDLQKQLSDIRDQHTALTSDHRLLRFDYRAFEEQAGEVLEGFFDSEANFQDSRDQWDTVEAALHQRIQQLRGEVQSATAARDEAQLLLSRSGSLSANHDAGQGAEQEQSQNTILRQRDALASKEAQISRMRNEHQKELEQCHRQSEAEKATLAERILQKHLAIFHATTNDFAPTVTALTEEFTHEIRSELREAKDIEVAQITEDLKNELAQGETRLRANLRDEYGRLATEAVNTYTQTLKHLYMQKMGKAVAGEAEKHSRHVESLRHRFDEDFNQRESVMLEQAQEIAHLKRNFRDDRRRLLELEAEIDRLQQQGAKTRYPIAEQSSPEQSASSKRGRSLSSELSANSFDPQEIAIPFYSQSIAKLSASAYLCESIKSEPPLSSLYSGGTDSVVNYIF